MKTGYLITARLKSTRLPLKLLREVEGRPIFSHMIDRLKLAKRVDQIVVCTSTNSQDDPLEEIARAEGVACFRGDEDDVVERLSAAADQFGLDYVLSITGDCPFVDPVYADKIFDAYLQTNADFIRSLGLPHGAFSYGIKPEAFRKILEIKDESDTEVWGRYFTDLDLFKVYDLPIENPLHNQPQLRMTLDYPEDLEFFKAVFAGLYKPERVFSLDEILNFLETHPEVVEINRRREADYLKRWTRQSSIKVKPRYQVNRALVIGSGSIGQRHIRNLRTLGITDIIALRSKRGSIKAIDPTLGVREVDDWQEIIDAPPDVAIVSNPSSLHLQTVKACLPHVRGIFVEKPLAAASDGVAEMLQQIRDRNVVSFVGYNLQFHPAVNAIREVLGSGRLGNALVFQGQVGHWVEDWHPGEDYTQSYVARKDLGGGVSLTLSHEIHLATELLGPAIAVSCVLPTSERLLLNVDVISDLMIQHAGGATSQLHLDMIQRPAQRRGVISCERGWVSYDLIMRKAFMESSEPVGTTDVTVPEPVLIWDGATFENNQPYVDEMRSFIDCVREGRVRHENDAWKAARTLALIEAAFASAESKCLRVVAE